jgi:hypothetical protein
MHSAHHFLSLRFNLVENIGSGMTITDGHDDGIVAEFMELTDRSQHWQAHDDCAYQSCIIIQEADGLAVCP